MESYILDTNSIIYFVKGDAKTQEEIEKILLGRSLIYISSITEVELFSSADIPTLEVLEIENMLYYLTTVVLDSVLARKASVIRKEYGLKTPDAVIAATAIHTGSTLVTRNVKDFKKISGLKIKKI